MSLETAIEQGFCRYNLPTREIEPLTPKPWTPPFIKKRIRVVATYPVRVYIIPVDPTTDDKGQRYLEDVEITSVKPYAENYEVARFYVPWGRIGIVRQCWQWLQIADATIPPLAGPYDAIYHARGAGGPASIVWKLRLSSGELLGPKLTLTTGLIETGYGFPELPRFSQIRFPWGSNAPVFWMVPEDTTLSLFCDIVSGKDEVQSIGGRLAGYTQPISSYSQHNTRHGWQW